MNPNRPRRSLLFHAARLTPWVAIALALAASPSFAAETNPPAILFDRDIKPIFAQSCLRCHGPERPKSGFRLTDRASALQGGSNHPDAIVPGNSAASKLLQFVAGQPEDMLMPPEGKGDPLTAGQVALLRQWIDAGAAWGEPPKPESSFLFSPGARWITVHGNEGMFRELEGMTPGWGGGLEHFSLTQDMDPRTKLRTEGHYLFDEQDAVVKLSLERCDVGFVRFGFEQWRSYYDDTGGYYRPGLPPAQDLDRELYLDHGRAWIDFGLTLPDWPRMVLGYEFQYRDGDKSMLNWGAVNERNTYPAAKQIDEGVHLLKFDLTFDVGGWQVEDNAQVEFYDLSTSRDQAVAYSFGPRPDAIERAREKTSAVQGVNSLRAEKQLREWWLLSAGYLFSRYDGESRLDQRTLDANGVPTTGQFWSTDDIVLRRDNHVASLASLFFPCAGLTASAAVQGEWTRQEGFGNVALSSGDPMLPPPFDTDAGSVDANLDRSRASESVNLRCTWIPWTVLFGDVRLDQEQTSEYEHLDEVDHGAFERDSDITGRERDLRAGFTTSPAAWLSFGGHYRQRSSDTDFDHPRDLWETNSTGDGYPAFIRERGIDTDELEVRLDLRPRRWLRVGLSYRHTLSEFTTRTDTVPGTGQADDWLDAADYDADTYSANVTLTPWQRLYLTTTFSYSQTRMFSGGGNYPSVVPYEGEVYAVVASARFAVNDSTDLHAAYAYSHSDYGQENYAASLPLGLVYTRHGLSAGISRKLNANCLVTVRYAFYQYDEPSSRGVNDYTAHGVFATLNYRWP